MPKSSKSNHWKPGNYDSKHGYVTEKGLPVLDWLAAAGHERILDLGCGTGHLTARIAAAAREAVGVDASEEMIAAARAAYPGLRFEVQNAAGLSIEGPFDAVFSNAALHWMRPPESVAAGVAALLPRGGRFVAEFGGKGNIDAVTWGLYLAFEANGLPAPVERNPWYFPSISEYGAVLEKHGFELRKAELFDRPIALEPGMPLRDWFLNFATPFFEGLTERQRSAILDYAEFVLRDSLFIHERWYVDYRRLRFLAVKTA